MHIIHIQSEAPIKPAVGSTCNGCGVCCLVEPCPLGMVLSAKRKGACNALRWDAERQQYRCGAITDADSVVRASLSHAFTWMTPVLSWAVVRLARRWIAAGVGCDSNLQQTSSALNDNVA
jgi:Fe-S-cluster-containing hydrogenase component 2